jgi:hypothetical protein
MTFQITTSSFAPGGAIPRAHTADGADVAPALAWSGAPAGTRSYALVVDDPDAPDPQAPRVVWVHWVLYNLPATCAGLPAGATADSLPAGAMEGRNDWNQTGWRGPSPPVGRHRYIFHLYALDIVLPDLRKPKKPALLEAMHGHVLGQAELVGTYERAH